MWLRATVASLLIASVTDEVAASFATSTSERYREVMISLVRHLHGFARDVRLTHAEWETAVDFLTRTGQISNGRRQEFIMLSDVLGLSMLTVGINAPASEGATESTVFGPFFVDDAPEHVHEGRIARHDWVAAPRVRRRRCAEQCVCSSPPPARAAC